MKTLALTLALASLALTAGTSAFGAALSKSEYKAGVADATSKYKLEKEGCKSLAGNARDICNEEAKGREKVTKAELEESYIPSEKHRYEVLLAKADAVYAIAKEKCDDLAGNAKDVCRKEAKSAYVTGKADAKVVEKSNDATAEARTKSADARKEAAVDKADAAYAVAKEKCDALANEAKVNCLKEAKSSFGKL